MARLTSKPKWSINAEGRGEVSGTMLDKEEVKKELDRLSRLGGFQDGYHLLYVPWNTIEKSRIAFISLNPGRTNKPENLEKLEELSGNSYEIEMRTSVSPLTQQFLDLAKLLEEKPVNILTGAYVPFRSNNWRELNTNQKQLALKFSRYFWTNTLSNVELIVSCGLTVTKGLVSSLDMTQQEEISSGWGNIKLRSFTNTQDQWLLGLPHLSTYKLMSRQSCKQAVETMITCAKC